MATRKIVSLHSTEYQYYVQSTSRQIIDFTERKLLSMIRTADRDKRQHYETILIKYRSGNIIVAWRDGYPIYSNVVNDGGTPKNVKKTPVVM